MSRCVLAIDQGTTSSRAMLFDARANVVGAAGQEFPQHFPKSGWVEHDPEDIWSTVVSTVRKVLSSARQSAAQIAAIGITNQRETTVLWDRKTGKPVCRAIVWQCRRTADLCRTLKERGLEQTVRRKTGLVIDAYFSGTKVRWMLDSDPEIARRAAAGELAFGTIDSWLVWNLTGGECHGTDYTNASRTMLFDIHEKRWDEELLEAIGVPSAVLPEVHDSAHRYGLTTADSFFGHQVPISGIAGDQQAALFGQGCWEPGTAKNTYGTGCFLVMNTGQKAFTSQKGLLTTLCAGKKGEPLYALEGSIFIAGAAVQWLRDELGVIEKASESEAIARSVDDSAGVYFVPAFVGLGAPYWDMDARGAIHGLTRGAGRAHIVRAALESIAYQTRDLMDLMVEEANLSVSELRVDGGACANDFLMQFVADVLSVSVDRPVNAETTSLGAAYLAGLAEGFWAGADELAHVRTRDRLFEPGMARETRETLYGGWKAAVSRVLSR